MRECQLTARQITNIAGNDVLRIARDCQFNQVVVRLVSQVWTPLVINTNRLTRRGEDVEKFVALARIQSRLCEERRARKYILVFGEKRVAQKWPR